MGILDSVESDGHRRRVVREAAMAVVITCTTACASPSGSLVQAQRDPLVVGCPAGNIRTCEVIGGNKFSKRYGRCFCSRG